MTHGGVPGGASPPGGKVRGLLPYAALLLGAVYLFRDAGHFAYAARPGELGPDVWPRAILVILMAVCIVEILRRALASAATPAAAGDSAGAHAAADEARRYPRLLAGGIVLTILYVLALEVLGFFVATVLFLALFMRVGRYRRIGVIAATSLLGSLAFVYVFMKIVYVSLPLGIGPFKQLSVWILRALGIH